MSSALDRRPLVPGHAIGTLSVGPKRKVWCSCGWGWEWPHGTGEDYQAKLVGPDALGNARRAERTAIETHRVLASAPTTVPGEEWVRDR